MVFVVLLVLAFGAFAQSPDSRVRVPINEKYLEHLIKLGVDSVRIAHGLEVLANDSILYVAARHHANYLGELNRVSHYEMEYDSLKTPQLRGRYYGVDSRYLIGENVAKGFHNKVVRSKKSREGHFVGTYAQVARDIVIGWVNSPGHYRNMITPNYEVTGLAVFIHPEDSSVFAVQKFAEILYQYQFKENKQFFPYSEYQTKQVTRSFNQVGNQLHSDMHAWGLRSVTDTATAILTNQIIDLDNKVMTAKVSGRTVYVETRGADNLWQALQDKRDGLALEIMDYGPYHCGNPEYYEKPGRRNGQCEFSGRVLKPVYRKKLVRGFRKPMYRKFWHRFKSNLKSDMKLGEAFRAAREYDFHPGYFKLGLGRIPKDATGFLEFNIVYIKNKEVVRVRHLTGACGQTYSEYEPLPYELSLNTDTLVYTPPELDSSFVFYFKKGESSYRLKDLYPLLGADFDKYVIDSVGLEAYSSVEGSEKVNLGLQKTRALAIVEALQEKRKLDYQPTIKTAANWELFQAQIDSLEDLAIFRGKTKERQKEMLDSLLTLPEESKKLEKYLAYQRYAKIHLKGTYDTPGYFPDFIQYLGDKLENDLYEAKRSKSAIKMAEVMFDFPRFQQLVKSHVLKGDLDNSYLFKYIPPKSLEFAECWFNLKVFAEEFGSEKFNKKTWTDIYGLYGADAKDEPRILQNFFVEQFNLLKEGKGEVSAGELKQVALYLGYHKGWEEMSQIMLLDVDFHIVNNNIEGEVFEAAMDEIYDHFMTHKVSPDRILKVAYIFSYYQDYLRCYNLIEPYIDFDNPHEGILVLYMKLFYQNIQEYPYTPYTDLVFRVKEVISERVWCDAFVGPCNISYQVFDDERIRDAYCESCAKYGNYATNYVEE